MSGDNVINLKETVQDKPVRSESVGQLIPREGLPQGAYSWAFQNNMRNAISPGLYEALREAIPMLDTAINNFNMLDGTPVVVGDNKKVVEELNRFMAEVQVGDDLYGMPAFVQARRDETHEQGFGISEHQIGPQGIFRLNVADSKAMHCARKDDGSLAWYYDPYQKSRTPLRPSATEQVAQILQHRTPVNISASFFDKKSFIELDRKRMHYMAYRHENSDAYGVSMLRSMPVFAETFLTIINAIDNTWERFGDPSFHLHYECSRNLGDKLDANGDTPLEARRKALASGLSAAVQSKRDGKSADLVTAVDKDSKITVSIIGAEGAVLDASVPLIKVVEQLSSGTGQPPWMLGVDAGTVQGQARFQSEVMQQGSASRNSREGIQLEQICKIHLRSIGMSWRDELTTVEDPFAENKVRHVRKDWRIEYNKPNLSDIVAKAQANFMNTQSDILRDRTGGQNNNTPISVTTEGPDGEKTTTTHNLIVPSAGKAANRVATPPSNHLHNLETRPIDNPALDKIEQDALQGIADEWEETALYLVRALGLDSASALHAMKPEGFAFTQADKDMIAMELSGFVSTIMENEGLAQGALAQAYTRAWAQGVIDAYTRSAVGKPVGELTNAAAVARILETSSAEFKTFIDNKLTTRIHRILEAGVEAGENPLNIAANLRREMDGAKWKWEQIARSETALAWDDAKRGEWGAEIEDGAIEDSFDFIPAPDGCPVCQSMAAGNPRMLVNTPKPVFDTHPLCRCDVSPAAPE